MQINQKVLDVWKSLVNGHKISVSVKKGKIGDRVYLRHENKSILVTYLMDLSDGQAIAVLTDQGNWYLIGEQEQGLKSNSTRTIEFRQTYNTRKPQGKGFVMWLDCNWLSPKYLRTNEATIENNQPFLHQLVNIFIQYDPSNIIYTGIPATIYKEAQETFGITGTMGNPPLPFLAAEFTNYEIREIDFSTFTGDIDELLIFPLYDSNTQFDDNTLQLIKKAATESGVIILGEWLAWREYENRLLNFLVGDRISYFNDYETYYWQVLENEVLGITAATVQCNATGTFQGCSDEEILAVDPNSGNPTVIYVTSENMI